MAETALTKYLKRSQPDPLADIGQGGPGLYKFPNPVPDEVQAIGQHFVPEYLRNNNVHAIEPNEVGKTPRSQPMNPLPWLATDIAGNLAGTGAKAAAPFMKSMLMGPLALTSDLGKLLKAKEMASEGAQKILRGVHPVRTGELLDSKYADLLVPSAMQDLEKSIFKETNWFRRPDAKWRTPIDDSKANITTALLRGEAPASEVFKHKAFFDGYPQFKDMPVELVPKGVPYSGGYRYGPEGVPGEMLIKWAGRNERTKTGLHELTHGVQSVEDFAPGSSPASMEKIANEVIQSKGQPLPSKGSLEENLLRKTSANLYNRHSGEDEARMVENLFEFPGMPPHSNIIPANEQVVPGNWLTKQSPEIQDYIKNTMTRQFQGGPPALRNYYNRLMLDAK